MHVIAEEGVVEVAELLFKAGAKLDLRDAEGCTPFLRAAATNNEAMAVYLLARGADVNTSNTFGWTALVYAAANGFLRLAEILLESGAEMNHRTKARANTNRAAAAARAESMRAGSEKGPRPFAVLRYGCE